MFLQQGTQKTLLYSGGHMIYFLGNCYLIKIFLVYKQTPKYTTTCMRLTSLEISVKISLSTYYIKCYINQYDIYIKYGSGLYVAYRCFQRRKLKDRLRVIVSARNSLKKLFFNYFWILFHLKNMKNSVEHHRHSSSSPLNIFIKS